ncbi:hypothetical protein Tco_1541059 [Tanacetum coccineum]
MVTFNEVERIRASQQRHLQEETSDWRLEQRMELKPALQCALLRSNPTTLSESFSSARATEARFAKDALSKLLQRGTVAEYQNEFKMLIKLLRARPTTLGEAFSLACIIEARFEDIAKGSLDANKEIKNDHTLVHELEKQEEKLPIELQLKNNFREALETTSKDLENTILDLNPTLHDLQKVSVDQKKKHYKTTHALKIVDEEFKKAKSEATTENRKLAKVYGAWLSPWLVTLKPALQCALLRSNPTTLSEAFSSARATKARFTKDALSKLLQRGTVAEYQNDFEMLISQVMGKSKSLLTTIYISELKVALQIELLRARPTTLGEAFSLACIIEARFEAIVHEEKATAEKEQSIKETTNTITSLQSEVASLKAKGSLDANKEIKNDRTLVHELEKQEGIFQWSYNKKKL